MFTQSIRKSAFNLSSLSHSLRNTRRTPVLSASYSSHNIHKARRSLFFKPLLGFLATGTVVATAVSYSTSNTALLSHCTAAETDRFAKTALFAPINPYHEGYLKVDDRHTVYYAQYGNPQGKPVLVVHGGPGGGTVPTMARFFDPKVYRIILVDQRGCGNSTPFADLVDNTTYDLVRDFEKIRKKLAIDKWQVFGGSWGSTLSLAYAIEHPDRVTELVLRGIFLLREKELQWMYQGPGGNFVFPEDWEPYEQAIPKNERHDYITAYGKRLRGELGEAEMHKAAKAWSVWEGETSKLIKDPASASKFAEDQFALAFARIENHYFTNKGFFPRDGFLLEDENLKKIRHIPTGIVQGRYDMVCPAVSAYDLHRRLPNSKLVFTLTGHSGFETEIIQELVKFTEEFKHNK